MDLLAFSGKTQIKMVFYTSIDFACDDVD